MLKPFIQIRSLCASLVFSVCLLGCASTPPKELVDARSAYQKAAHGPAARYSPAELHTAQESLKLAESSFEDDGDSDVTRDQAYMALRQTQLADTQARIVQNQAALEASKERAEQQRGTQLADAQKQLADEAARRKAAEESLAQLAQVKQEERGTVITLSGSVLFPSDKAELLPEAQQRLAEVAKALNSQSPNAQIVIEGHSDGKGSKTYNLELSARRAEAVRNYLVTQGIASNRISSQGLGFSHPISDNKTAEGRANNRRVEIVVQPTQGMQGGAPRTGT
jgi:outer membrane protein OmpA-like peptidoglycan-associated protein